MVTDDVLNSPVQPVLLNLDAIGVRFRLEGERVLVSPSGALTPDQRDVLRQHQATVRTLVAIRTDKGVHDRRGAFARQLDKAPSGVLVPRFVFREVP